jgi:putative Ca2+/H+ antiporter (TMEM165/GDT1 family)
MTFMAEWGDKTQIASALFATTYQPIFVFLGVMAALLLLSFSAIYLGKFISHRIPTQVTTKVAGVLFVLMGILAFL